MEGRFGQGDLGVLSSVGGAYAAAHRDDWFIPAIVGATCAFLWDALEKLIDHRVKATDKIDKQTLALAEKRGETRTELLTVFRRSVSEKTKRLMNKLAKRKVTIYLTHPVSLLHFGYGKHYPYRWPANPS